MANQFNVSAVHTEAACSHEPVNEEKSYDAGAEDEEVEREGLVDKTDVES